MVAGSISIDVLGTWEVVRCQVWPLALRMDESP